MLADVSKALGKSFFLGAFLPALFLSANIAGMVIWAIDSKIGIGQIDFALTAGLTFALAFLIAVTFWSLNLQIVRFYEGYPISRWQFARRRLQSQCRKLRKEIASLRTELEGQDDQPSSLQDYLRLTDWQVKAELEYPPEEDDILPTKLGNIIRGFEYYPATRYSIEPITIWPRLLAILPQKQVDAINTEKSFVDFWLNLSLSFLILGPLWVTTMWYVAIFWPFFVPVLVGAVLLGYLAYRMAIPNAVAWGYEVRTAFDLYRCDLLRKLGFKRPASLTAERALWDKIFWFFNYEDYAKEQGLPQPDSSNQKRAKGS